MSNHGRWFSVGLWSLTFSVSVVMRTEISIVDVQTCTGPIHRSTPDEPPPIGRLVIFRKETLQGAGGRGSRVPAKAKGWATPRGVERS
jgi:hypothetical protein